MADESTEPSKEEINGENDPAEAPMAADANGTDDTKVEDISEDSPKDKMNGDENAEADGAPLEEKSDKEEEQAKVVADDSAEDNDTPKTAVDEVASTTDAAENDAVAEDDPENNTETAEPTSENPQPSNEDISNAKPRVKEDEKKTDSASEVHVEDDEKKDSEIPSTSASSETAEVAANEAVVEADETFAEEPMSTPVSSPNRPSSLSSTPDRPSSLSSTPERNASLDQAAATLTNFEVQDDDTWTAITKRDRPLSNANAIHVMDHAHTVLEKRIGDATDDFNMKDNLRVFKESLGRFQNSEIKLGRRLASGNFADIFLVTSFIPVDVDKKPCNKKQRDAAEEVKMKWRPNELVIKVLRGNLLLNPSLYATAAADFITEGTLLASLDHPHIVSLRGRSVTSVEGFASGKRDSVFLVLERLHGDLTHKVMQWRERQSQNRIIIKGLSGLRDGRAIILKERLLAMAQLADALDYLHKRNIIHRDLKLSNVGVDARGRMQLLDFGLAKILPPSKQDNETFLLTGNTGSARYMAPEVARAEPYNLKADVYSFAILFYEVMNLDKAFQGWQARDISDRVHQKKYRPRLPLVWPASVREILRTTWSDLPNARLSMKHVHSMLVKELKELQEATT